MAEGNQNQKIRSLLVAEAALESPEASKSVSEVGFEPTPSYEDQNAQYPLRRARLYLESGALDHSAILTRRARVVPSGISERSLGYS